MPVERTDFDALGEADLEELRSVQAPEGLRLEYKRDAYGSADKDKREALKDISSFANTSGGHLIIGIEESGGIPIGLRGLTGVDADEEVLRLEQLVRSGTEPRIQGIRTRAIPLTSGGHCIVMRIPRSWHAPHRVSSGGVNRFFLRNSAGVHEASVEELRTMFTQGADAAERARAFRENRVANVDMQRTQRRLAKGVRAILHIIPLAGITGLFQLDVAEVINHWSDIKPLGSAAADYHFNLDGVLIERGGEKLFGYVQVFRSGALETVQVNIQQSESSKTIVWGNSLEARIGKAVPEYMAILKQLGVPPPFVVTLTLEGMLGVVVRVGARLVEDGEEPAQYESVLTLPEALIEEYGSDRDYALALRSVFDAIWNMAGKARSLAFDKDGNWKPKE